MTDPFTQLANRLAEMERRFDSMVRHGPVMAVDLVNHLVRTQVGLQSDGVTPSLSPWVPYAQIAGGLKVHNPPTVGQQMTLFSPAGDFRQAVALPLGWSDAQPSPSTAADPVLTYGSFTFTLMPTLFTIVAGAVTLTLDAAAGTITLAGNKIITSGLTYLGGADASRPSSASGTTDSHGDSDTGNFATKVFVK